MTTRYLASDYQLPHPCRLPTTGKVQEQSGWEQDSGTCIHLPRRAFGFNRSYDKHARVVTNNRSAASATEEFTGAGGPEKPLTVTGLRDPGRKRHQIRAMQNDVEKHCPFLNHHGHKMRINPTADCCQSAQSSSTGGSAQ